MKKIVLTLASIALLAMFSACGKEHKCMCTYADGQDEVNSLNVLLVDGSIQCEDISEFAFEEHMTTEDGVQTLHHVNVHKVNCRD